MNSIQKIGFFPSLWIPKLTFLITRLPEEVVELLIGCGAKLDAQNIHGEIPEELAALAGFEKIVNMLRGAGH